MERLSNKSPCKDCKKDQQIGNPYAWQTPCHNCEERSKWISERLARLDVIEGILGENYDLSRLRKLVQADGSGKCIIIPDFVWKVGESRGVIKIPYKSWMGRFIGTKFYRTEKEAAEAALKERTPK